MEDITTKPDYNFAEADENMLREVIDRYSQPILRYCHHILCSYADAQDAAQTTFIKAYENRSRYKNGASLTAWLYRIAYRTCIDMIRRRRFLILPEKPVETDADTGLIGDDLKAALLTLKPADRALVFSRVLDNKDYAELEEVYGVSAAALRKRYERARKKLAAELAAYKPQRHLRLEES